MPSAAARVVDDRGRAWSRSAGPLTAVGQGLLDCLRRLGAGVLIAVDRMSENADPDRLADPGGVRQAAARAGPAVRSGARRGHRQDRRRPRGGRPAGERRLPRGPRGAGPAGGPDPPAGRHAAPRRGGRGAGRRRRGRPRHPGHHRLRRRRVRHRHLRPRLARAARAGRRRRPPTSTARSPRWAPRSWASRQGDDASYVAPNGRSINVTVVEGRALRWLRSRTPCDTGTPTPPRPTARRLSRAISGRTPTSASTTRSRR